MRPLTRGSDLGLGLGISVDFIAGIYSSSTAFFPFANILIVLQAYHGTYKLLPTVGYSTPGH